MRREVNDDDPNLLSKAAETQEFLNILSRMNNPLDLILIKIESAYLKEISSLQQSTNEAFTHIEEMIDQTESKEQTSEVAVKFKKEIERGKRVF